MRTACLIVPQLAVQLALQRRPELAGSPVIVGDDLAGRRAVIDASAYARACGVAPGMPLRRASGLCPVAAIVPLDAPSLASALTALRALLDRFSPTVQAEPPETFYFDAGGVDLRTLGRDGPPGEAALLLALVAEIAGQTGLRAAAGSGAGMFVARLAALAAPLDGVCAVPAGAEQATLGSAPIEALPCSTEMARRLRLYGLRSVAEFVALPFGPVQAQFGKEGGRLWRLAACLDASGPIADSRAPSLSETLELPAPSSDISVLTRAAELLLRRLFRRRETGNRLARRLSAAIALESGATWERTITFRAATADPARALTALQPRLDALALPAAATTMTLTLHDLCGERALQGSLFHGKARQLAQLGEEIRQLRARLGIAPILRIIEVEPWSRIPERRRALAEYLP